MAIVTRVGKGSKLTIEEMDNNLLSLETDISGNVSAITSKLDKGSYTGTAQDLKALIDTKGIVGPTGATGSGLKVTTWSAGAYALGDQVNHLGKDWTANAATVAGDIPGTSSKWSERLFAYNNVKSLLDSTANQNFVDYTGQALTGFYRDINGTLITQAQSFYTPLIFCYPGQIIRFTGSTVANGSQAVTGFNSAGVFVSVLLGAVSNAVDLEVTIPASVRFISFSSYNAPTFAYKKSQWKLEGSYINVDDLLNAGTYAKKAVVQPFSLEKATVTEFSSNVGFTDVATGISGVAGAGSKLTYDFSGVDTAKEFRFDIIFTINATTAASFLKINLKNKALNFLGDNFLQFTNAVSTSYFYGANVMSTTDNFTGAKFQFSIIGHLGNITYSVIRLDTDWNGVIFSSGFQTAHANRACIRTRKKTELNSTVLPFEFCNFLEITATNANEFVINSVNINKTSLKDQLFPLRTIYAPKVYNDNIENNTNYHPIVMSKASPLSLMQWHHPNGTTGSIYNADTFSEFYKQSIAICFLTGNSFNNPTGTNLFGAGVSSSNWGAITGMKYRKKLMDLASGALQTKSIINFGGSMGGLNALAYSTMYPDDVACIVSISGALDLITNFNNSTFTNIIRKAYSSAYVALVANTNVAVTDTATWLKISNEKSAPNVQYYENNPFYDTYSTSKAYIAGDVAFVNYAGIDTGLNSFSPYLNGNKLSIIPTLLIHGDADTIIPLVQSSAYLSYINSKGGVKTELITVVGGGHVTADCFRTTEIMDFINRHL
jgi:pimeloyl-ACP methyl ester carboxylesterase